MGRFSLSAVVGSVFALLSLGTPVLAKPTPCPGGRFVIPGKALTANPAAPANDQIEITGTQIVIASGCTGKVHTKAAKRFTMLKATFASCTGLTGKAAFKAKIATPACDTMTGTLTNKKTKPKKKSFKANRVPIFTFPQGMTVGAEGGTFTNPTDGTSVTVPPGAFAAGQMAHVSVVAVSNADVVRMESALGIVPPTGFNLISPLQVLLDPGDPDPTLAFSASMPDGGFNGGGTLIHTLIEPTFVGGFMDPKPTHLVFDGEVTQGGGTFSFQISPQNFGSPPGRSCVVQIPSTPTCFIDGVVRDTNGSPVADALVSVSNLALVARTNAAGFYRGVVLAGSFTATATAASGTGTTSRTCDPNTAPRIAGVDIVIGTPLNPAVPKVTITNKPTMSVDSTVFNVTGTVTPDTVTEVTVVGQTGDFADPPFPPQTVTVTGGTFSTNVVLTRGRENTIIVTATAGGLTGSDSTVVTVTGVFGEDLRFTLTWDTDASDVDLYVRTPGPNGVADDVDGTTLYFFVTSGDGGTLDIDNTIGFGPENITFPVGSAAPGTYAFAAEYFSGTPATTPTLSVFVKGRLVGTFVPQFALAASDTNTFGAGLTLASPNAVFNAGTVTFPGGALSGPSPQTVFQGP